MTRMLTHTALRTPEQLPPALTTDEVAGLLRGELQAPNKQAIRAYLAADPQAPAYRTLYGQLPSDGSLADPRAWIGSMSVALLECLIGRRPVSQLARHVTPGVQSRLNRRYRAALRRGGTPGHSRVLRIRVCQITPRVVEAALVTRVNGRPCPIAVRMEATNGRWVISVLELL